MLYFIVNSASKSGKGRKQWEQIKEYMFDNAIVYKAFLTKHAGHATELAKSISELDDDDIGIVVVGGDGTINEVINGISDFSKVRLAVIPNGSGNDFCRGMNISNDALSTLEDIIDIFSKGRECYTPIDLGQTKWNNNECSRLFAISSGIGLDAIVCKATNESLLKRILNIFHLASMSYGILTVKCLFSMETIEAEIESCSTYTEELSFKKLIYLAAMNQFAEGGGVPMAPDANCTDGLISFGNASGIPKWKTFLCFPLLLKGKHQKIKGFRRIDAKALSLKLSSPIALHTDGEYLGEVGDVSFNCLEGIVRYMK